MVTSRENGRALYEKARRIRLVLTDCDGVLTDGSVYYSQRGEEMKCFSMRDGMGVERLRRLADVDVGIITGETSPSLRRRAEKLGITELHLGVRNKMAAVGEIVERRNLALEQVAYIGDDTNDAAVMQAVGLSACPADAMCFARDVADYVCESDGGHGAFREFAELIATSRGCGFEEGDTRNGAWVEVGDRAIGEGEPVYVIAEIGINHNGSLEIAKEMIEGAVYAGCDAVKFQKRTPELCVPYDQWYVERDTPWGRLPYIEYRHRVEFDAEQFAEIDRFCREQGIAWFASCWDKEAVDFIEQFNPPLYMSATTICDWRRLMV